ncbi:hypothetical protein FVEG_15497 [Fusarium verticillioides 7600]|uniref:Uncharacterized protein n=1 Tax=Gibberella moniliformis (strain M3125 / FGSC 7600) TaxID=334819 RepID=W7MDF1_GIBM7|nr:hypothetical protein FVEG_15497 [Fusarium verticillioides 7600]EWG42817.1 hypothetical protein FVEG_15497 [Fusarium verticillioides 7600]
MTELSLYSAGWCIRLPQLPLYRLISVSTGNPSSLFEKTVSLIHSNYQNVNFNTNTRVAPRAASLGPSRIHCHERGRLFSTFPGKPSLDRRITDYCGLAYVRLSCAQGCISAWHVGFQFLAGPSPPVRIATHPRLTVPKYSV